MPHKETTRLRQLKLIMLSAPSQYGAQHVANVWLRHKCHRMVNVSEINKTT